MNLKYLKLWMLAALMAVSFNMKAEETAVTEAEPTSESAELATAEAAPEAAPQKDGDSKAKQILEQIKKNTSFGGFVIGRTQYNTQELSSSNKKHLNFDLRLVRLYIDGKAYQFQYKLQLQCNGIGKSTNETGPRIVDAWIEWQHWKEFRIKFGQFKRAFMFENPMNPWDIGFGGYAQATDKLSGMTDRNGEHSSNGRDVGIQLQGDLIPAKDGHGFVHYMVGIYNGQGINHSDDNNHKDLIGGIYVSPIKALQIGGWGWNGKYTESNVTVDRKRWSFGAKYDDGRNYARAEWVTSKGYKISEWNSTEGAFDNGGKGDKSDGWYVMAGTTFGKGFKLFGKWDVYRDYKCWDTAKSIYGIAANYYFYKDLKLQVNYNYVHDKSSGTAKNYSQFELQVYWRFKIGGQ